MEQQAGMSDQWDTEQAIHLLPSMWRHTLLASRLANGSLPESAVQDEALSELGLALAQAQHWEQAQQVIEAILESDVQVEALMKLVEVLVHHHEDERALQIVHSRWQQVKGMDEALCLLPLAYPFISSHPDLGIAFFEALT